MQVTNWKCVSTPVAGTRLITDGLPTHQDLEKRGGGGEEETLKRGGCAWKSRQKGREGCGCEILARFGRLQRESVGEDGTADSSEYDVLDVLNEDSAGILRNY